MVFPPYIILKTKNWLLHLHTAKLLVIFTALHFPDLLSAENALDPDYIYAKFT